MTADRLRILSRGCLDELERRAKRTWFGAACYWVDGDHAKAVVWNNGAWTPQDVGAWIESVRRRCPEARRCTIYDARNGGAAVGGFIRDGGV